MKNVFNFLNAKSTAASKFFPTLNFVFTLIVCVSFGMLSMSFQTMERPDVINSEECPIANFNVNNNGCLGPCTINFNNLSTNATSYLWDFGDGNTSTEISPQHLYLNAGSYSVKLIAIGDGCELEFIGTVDVLGY